MQQSVDTIIRAGWVIPVEPRHQVLADHAIAIRDGVIVAILPAAVMAGQYRATTHHHLAHHAVIPGLINSHTHAAMSLLRGLADDLPLMSWLHDHIWPAEGRCVSPQFVRDGTQLAIAEMLRGGTTCFNEMYFFPDEVAAEASRIGIRAVVGLIVIDFPTAWARDGADYLRKGLAVHDRFRHDPLIRTAFAPHAPYSVSDGPLEQVLMYAEELDLPIHMHVHETAAEVAQQIAATGERPLTRLARLGLLSPRLLAVHMTQLDAAEIELIASRGVHLIHCPESNLKLASGFAPIATLAAHGVNIALGTDGAASNNDLDMFGEMRTAALLAKGVSGDASAIAAAVALEMATLNGARALGLGDQIGSLVVGKQADLVAVDLSLLETQPVYDPISQLVYAASRHQVSDLWIAGRQLLQQRQLLTLDPATVVARAQQWQPTIRGENR
jgi:5-methylthioadenosine/S-adenosylhomocysteine deaminase